jgi:hypothetical protein
VRPGNSFCSSDIELGVFSENQRFTADELKPFGSIDDEIKGTIVGVGMPGTGIPQFPLTHSPPPQTPLDLEKEIAYVV